MAFLRLVVWLRAPLAESLSEAEADTRIARTQILAFVIASVFIGWTIALDWSSNGVSRDHVVVAVAATMLSCLLCLMQAPKVAGMVATSVVVPFFIYCLTLGSLSAIVIAANIALVAGVVVKVLGGSHRMFVDLIRSQQALSEERHQASRLSDENQLLAHTDPLTGLPNRRHFFARLDACLRKREAETQAQFCVGVLDLDRFKPINDTFGHAVGDKLLGEIGRRLSAYAADDLLIARLGGDEFGVLIDGGGESACRRVQALREAVCAPVTIQDAVLRVGCSVGLASYPDAGRSAHALFDRSDYALYHAKSHERGQCVIFSREHEALIRDEHRLETALRHADLDGELSLVFQPIYEARGIGMTGVEALARWQSPILGQVAPDRLIAMAERLGMINQITRILFAKALAELPRLPDGIGMNFNLSVHDIASPETVHDLIGMIGESGIDPRRLTFEITETALMSDCAAARATLGRLRKLGARVALDDFGTGYSNLGMLHQIPLDVLKVDRSLAAEMTTPSGRAMIAAIRSLAQSLSLECVIEGVENDAQLAEVSLLGCRYAQGYLLGRPMPMGTLLRAVREDRRHAQPESAAA
ncbi:EAL domain-containing protein [Sphingomonas sp. ST-64]|uniref:EAL domain-containing protein n=1 Tax=Sphingomonas plantiphila TaxID=3163295 RepID=A0ABW8YPH6_9SPHN